jgi:hypothetical protein
MRISAKVEYIMLKLYWFCATKRKQDEKYVQNSLHELNAFLEMSPTKIRIEVQPLCTDIAKKVNQILEKESFNKKTYPLNILFNNKKEFCPLRELYDKINSLSGCMPLVIYCEPTSNIANAIRKTHKIAEWGLTFRDHISAVYEKGNKYILWHEVLHLFGVDDCYDLNNPDGPLKCELNQCIMQYAPQEGNVTPWPFLCKNNIKRLREYIGNMDQG